jgi:hypothetical protein
MAAARKKFPNASGQALAQAANYYLPFMTEEDQARLRELLYTNNAAYHQGQLGVAETNAQTKAADVGSKIDYRAQALKLKEEYMNRADARAAATRQQAAAIAAQRTDIATQQQTRLIQEAITRAQTAYSVSLNNNGLAFQNDPDQLKAHNDQAEATYNATLDNLNAQAQKMSAKGKQSMNTPVPGSPEWSAKRVALGMSATPQYGGANA